MACRMFRGEVDHKERFRPEIIRPQTIKERRVASLFSTFNVLISQFLRGEEIENGE